MTDYFQKDVPILINLEGHKELLQGLIAEDRVDAVYDARLIYNQRKPEVLKLHIYYQPADYLFEKLEFLQKSGINVLDLIHPTVSPNAWVHPEFFEFSRSSLIEIRESHYFEHDKKKLILILDHLDLFENGQYARDARFRLTENIFPHLEEYFRYGQLGSYKPDDTFIESISNRETRFGPVHYTLSFDHSYKPGDSIKDFVITRDAQLKLRDESEKLTDRDLLGMGEDLCLLMSLYWEKNIDFFNAAIKVIDRDGYRNREAFKLCSENFDPSKDYNLGKHFATIYDFTDALSFEKFQNHKELVQEAVPRLIRVKDLDDISAFMILYNIVEKFRNFFLSNPQGGKRFTVKEEFEFTLSKTKTIEFIKEKIREIGQIVTAADKDEFDAKASQKVTFIKKTGLKDQFEGFVKYLGIDPANYALPFEDLIRVRNIIYHGNTPDEDISLYNGELKKLVLDVLLKIMIP